MQKENTSFGFRARYFVLGKPSPVTESLWFTLHGQGQLANYFSRNFNSIVSEKTCVIVPEGLSRYYLEGFDGRVGATWMTREERLTDIQNYLAYLDSIYSNIISKLSGGIPKITLLGFSQGAATASRWIMEGNSHFDRLILWSGIFPPDLEFKKGPEKFNNVEVVSVRGSNDAYLSKDRIDEQSMLSTKLGVAPREIIFNGGHEIDQKSLIALA